MGKGLDALIAQTDPKIVTNARKKAEAILEHLEEGARDSGNTSGPRLGGAKGLFEVPNSIDEMNAEVAKLFLGAQRD